MTTRKNDKTQQVDFKKSAPLKKATNPPRRVRNRKRRPTDDDTSSSESSDGGSPAASADDSIPPSGDGSAQAFTDSDDVPDSDSDPETSDSSVASYRHRQHRPHDPTKAWWKTHPQRQVSTDTDASDVSQSYPIAPAPRARGRGRGRPRLATQMVRECGVHPPPSPGPEQATTGGGDSRNPPVRNPERVPAASDTNHVPARYSYNTDQDIYKTQIHPPEHQGGPAGDLHPADVGWPPPGVDAQRGLDDPAWSRQATPRPSFPRSSERDNVSRRGRPWYHSTSHRADYRYETRWCSTAPTVDCFC